MKKTVVRLEEVGRHVNERDDRHQRTYALIDGALYEGGAFGNPLLILVRPDGSASGDRALGWARRNLPPERRGSSSLTAASQRSEHHVVCPCGEVSLLLTYGSYELTATCPSCGVSGVVYDG